MSEHKLLRVEHDPTLGAWEHTYGCDEGCTECFRLWTNRSGWVIPFFIGKRGDIADFVPGARKLRFPQYWS